MIIDTADIKAHLRIDHADEDTYLESLGSAAVEAFNNYCDKLLFAVGSDLSNEPENAMIITDAIKHGALLMIGHWYENRESSIVGTSVVELPMATSYLWNPYRTLGL